MNAAHPQSFAEPASTPGGGGGAPDGAARANPSGARDPRWDALTAPFPADQIEKLPKILSREDRDKGRCAKGSRYTADGHVCGGYHARAVHLDYVGHAGITMRLNDVVGPENWAWEPYTATPEGLPGWKRDEFWIRLTILGVTKIGVGDDSSSPKVLIGDALRNAAMRFGIATYLWSKSDAAAALAAHSEPGPEPEKRAERLPATPTDDQWYTAPPVAPEDPTPMSDKTRAHLFVLFAAKGVTEDTQLAGANHILGTDYTSRKQFTERDAQRIIAVLKKRPDAPAPAKEEA